MPTVQGTTNSPYKFVSTRGRMREDNILPRVMFNTKDGWKGQAIDDPDNWVHYFDDFLGADIVGGTTATNLQWKLLDVAGGTEVIVTGSNTYPNGMMSLNLSASDEVQQAGMTWNNNLCIPKSKSPIFECRAALHTLLTTGTETSKLFIGLGTAGVTTATTVTDYSTMTQLVGFSATSTDNIIQVESDDNTTDTAPVASSTTMVADVFHTFRFDLTNTADARFYIDNARVGSSTTFDFSATSTQGLQPVILVEKNKTAANTATGALYVDWVKISWKRS